MGGLACNNVPQPRIWYITLVPLYFQMQRLLHMNLYKQGTYQLRLHILDALS